MIPQKVCLCVSEPAWTVNPHVCQANYRDISRHSGVSRNPASLQPFMSRQERGTSPRATPTGTSGKFEDCAPLRRHSHASGNPCWLSHLHFPGGGGQAPALQGEAVFQSVTPTQAGIRVGFLTCISLEAGDKPPRYGEKQLFNPSFPRKWEPVLALSPAHPWRRGTSPRATRRSSFPVRHSRASGNPCWLSHLQFPGGGGQAPALQGEAVFQSVIPAYAGRWIHISSATPD